MQRDAVPVQHLLRAEGEEPGKRLERVPAGGAVDEGLVGRAAARVVEVGAQGEEGHEGMDALERDGKAEAAGAGAFAQRHQLGPAPRRGL